VAHENRWLYNDDKLISEIIHFSYIGGGVILNPIRTENPFWWASRRSFGTLPNVPGKNVLKSRV